MFKKNNNPPNIVLKSGCVFFISEKNKKAILSSIPGMVASPFLETFRLVLSSPAQGFWAPGIAQACKKDNPD